MAAARLDAIVASAPNPASIPDHSRRLTKGLSNIESIQADLVPAATLGGRRGAGAGQATPPGDCTSPRQIVSTIIVLARSSSASPTAALSKIQPVSTCSTEP